MRLLIPSVLIAALALPTVAQKQPSSATPSPRLELPAHLLNKIEAGKTPVGTPVQAKLMMATLVRGQVVPENSVLSGMIEESTVKTKETPSRLRIHITSAKWQTGETKLDAYITSMYHPFWSQSSSRVRNQPLGLQSPDAYNNDENVERQQRHEELERAAARSQDTSKAPGPDVGVSSHRYPLPDATVATDADGSTSIVSARHNLKLDTKTIYVFQGAAQ